MSQLYSNSSTSSSTPKTSYSYSTPVFTSEVSRTYSHTTTQHTQYASGSSTSTATVKTFDEFESSSVSSSGSQLDTTTHYATSEKISSTITSTSLEITTYDYTQLLIVTGSDTTFSTEVLMTTEATFAATSSFTTSSAPMTTDYNSFSKFMDLHDTSSHSGGLSKGSKAGIAVGTVFGFLLALGLVFIMVRHRKGKKGAFDEDALWEPVQSRPNLPDLPNSEYSRSIPAPPPPRKRNAVPVANTVPERLIDVLYENSEESPERYEGRVIPSGRTPQRYESHLQNVSRLKNTGVEDVGDTLGSLAMRDGRLRPQTWYSDIDSSDSSIMSDSSRSHS
ncbi:hypothetical protein OGAPHI_007291 [Ogataea philodendri]|uniref:Uncharacterized protein n=1 Tax=Ogataea philodendri TaxID=1378263 RepID=A0A9P8NVN7_9ASCO|nr:uncharacterized protein OGAPHI_007291 [Ogataea philodendri]KAH3660086.1 hypothetical protein OGAPHI_007291 [Ogataea philodendri]